MNDRIERRIVDSSASGIDVEPLRFELRTKCCDLIVAADDNAESLESTDRHLGLPNEKLVIVDTLGKKGGGATSPRSERLHVKMDVTLTDWVAQYGMSTCVWEFARDAGNRLADAAIAFETGKWIAWTPTGAPVDHGVASDMGSAKEAAERALREWVKTTT